MDTPISLTELRQRLFQLADQVAETGEPLIIVRNGVRLRLVRDEQPAETGGRLARLVSQTAVIGPPLAPNESPAVWNIDAPLKVAEPKATYDATPPKKRRRRS